MHFNVIHNTFIPPWQLVQLLTVRLAVESVWQTFFTLNPIIFPLFKVEADSLINVRLLLTPNLALFKTTSNTDSSILYYLTLISFLKKWPISISSTQNYQSPSSSSYSSAFEKGWSYCICSPLTPAKSTVFSRLWAGPQQPLFQPPSPHQPGYDLCWQVWVSRICYGI